MIWGLAHPNPITSVCNSRPGHSHWFRDEQIIQVVQWDPYLLFSIRKRSTFLFVSLAPRILTCKMGANNICFRESGTRSKWDKAFSTEPGMYWLWWSSLLIWFHVKFGEGRNHPVLIWSWRDSYRRQDCKWILRDNEVFEGEEHRRSIIQR